MMKKIACFLALLLALTALLPALAEEPAADVTPGLPVYVWLRDLNVDIEGILEQVPDMETLKKKSKEWNGADSNYLFYSDDDSDDAGHGVVWYEEDGSIRMVRLSGFACQAYQEPVQAAGYDYLSADLWVYYTSETVCLDVWTVSGEGQTLTVNYSRDGRMTDYVYYLPNDGPRLRFNAIGEFTGNAADLSKADADKLPYLVGDPMDFTGVNFVPDVKIHAYIQDAGVDVAAYLAMDFPPPPEVNEETGEVEEQEPLYDEAGNLVWAGWNGAGDRVTQISVEFAEPLEGSWTSMTIWLDGETIILSSPQQDCNASYLTSGELYYYTYRGPVGEAFFDPDGTIWDAPSDNEALMALYTPLEVIPAAGDYSDDNLLGIVHTATRAVYATLPEAFRPYLEAVLNPPEITEQDGVFTIQDDGYMAFGLSYANWETGEGDYLEGRYDGESAWSVDASWLDLSAYDSVALIAEWDDDAGNHTLQRSYPEMGSMYLLFFVEDENGYRMLQAYNGYEGNDGVRLHGANAFADYDLEGVLTNYAYWNDDMSEYVDYASDGTVQRVIPEGLDLEAYPPLEIIGN